MVEEAGGEWQERRIPRGQDAIQFWELTRGRTGRPAFPAIIQLVGIGLDAFVAGIRALVELFNRQNEVKIGDPIVAVPPFYGPPRDPDQFGKGRGGGDGMAARGSRDGEDAEGQYFSIVVNADFFTLLGAELDDVPPDDVRRALAATVLGQDLPPDALPPPGTPMEFGAATLPPAGPPEEDVCIVAIIDDRIGIGHDRFQRADGSTRVEYAWIQDGRFDPAAGIPYGRELTKAEIDTLFARFRQGGLYDEAGFYRECGLMDFGQKGRNGLGRRLTHGTHVLDCATGFPRAGDQSKRPIITVQLPVEVTEDTSGLSLEPHVMLAIDYILDRAARISVERGSGQLPLVINFSYGMIAAQHDGTSPIERRLDQIVTDRNAKGWKTAVTLPSGNNHLSMCHAMLSFDKCGEEKTLTLRVPPDDRTASFVELWVPFDAADPAGKRIEVAVTPFGAPQSPFLPQVDNSAVVWTPVGQTIVALVGYDFFGPPVNRGRFTLALAPTWAHVRTKPLAPSGGWTIHVRNLALKPGETVNAWVQRDDTPIGFARRGRQCRFDQDPEYRRFTGIGDPVFPSGWPEMRDRPAALIRRHGLMNGLSTGDGPYVLGGYVASMVQDAHPNESAAPYSGVGPTEDGAQGAAQPAPDAMAESDRSFVRLGILRAGTMSGSTVALNGTSVASPQAARWIADQLAKGPPPAKADLAAAPGFRPWVSW
jgi:hypothetical protein